MSIWVPKRFWKEATVEREAQGFGVRLDGRGVKTPAKTALILPSRALAEAVAAEWDAQEEKIDPTTMPVTRAANAALDKVRAQFDEVAGLIAAYGETDLLCYRADAPQELADRQAEAWDPLLDWAEAALGEGRLADALAELQALPESGRAAMADWTETAQARLDAVAAAEALAASLNVN